MGELTGVIKAPVLITPQATRGRLREDWHDLSVAILKVTEFPFNSFLHHILSKGTALRYDNRWLLQQACPSSDN